jgi:hypothetical protein
MFGDRAGTVPPVRILSTFPNGRELTERELMLPNGEVTFEWGRRHAVIVETDDDWFFARHPWHSAGSYALLLATAIAAARASGALVQTHFEIIDGLPTANRYPEYEPEILLEALKLRSDVPSIDAGSLQILGRTAYGRDGWNPDSPA